MASKPEKIQIYLLCVGIEELTKDVIKDVTSTAKITYLPYDLDKLMEIPKNPPHLVICGPAAEGINITEIAQMLSMQYQNIPIFLAAFNRTGFDRKLFIKNGFTDAFVLPIDSDELKRKIKEYFSKLTSGEIKSYKSVKLVDLEADVKLNFDTTIFLPNNKKYIKFTNAGDPIDQERLEKLNKHKMSALYVSTDQMEQFYKFTAERLRQLGSSSKYSETEKKEKTEEAIRNLVSGIFTETAKETTFEQGQALLTDCRQIVDTFICDSSNGDWYKRLLNTMGEITSTYGHASNVSTYAALFSMGLKIGDPGEVAIAGLLHDLGLANVPPEIVAKKEKERTKEEQEEYQKHPEYTIQIIKKRKIVLNDTIVKAILQHHEHYNGTGYPKGIHGNQISKEAQILALADNFDDLTSAEEGKPLMTPKEAAIHFKKLVLQDPGKMIFNPELLNGVLRLFPEST